MLKSNKSWSGSIRGALLNCVWTSVGAGVAFSPLFAMQASAQTSDVPSAQVDDEIIVTARKRAESLLDISGSVQVLSPNIISDYNLDDVDTLIDFVPNATFNAAPSGTPVIAIRGLGTRPGSALLEQDAGLFVDGVWLGRNNQLNSALIDVAQIEVLKGTQATLYGRNTLAGAVSIATVKPGQDFEGYVKGGYEFNYDSSYLEGAVTVPLTEKLSVRVASKLENQGGYIENDSLNRDEPDVDTFAIRGTAVYSADNGAEFTGRLQYSDLDRAGSAFVRNAGDAPSSTTFTTSPFPGSALSGYNENALGRAIVVPGLDLEDVGAETEFLDWSFQAEIPVGDLTLTSITAGSSMDLESVFDVFLRNPGPRIIGYFDEDYGQFTQEIRLSSPGGEKFDYIVGAFYLDQSVERLTFQYVNAADRFWSGEQDVKSWAIFGSGTYSFNDDFRFVGGLRYTDENKDADIIVHGQQEPALSFANVQEDVDSSFLAGSATFEYDATDDLLLFAGYSRGAKAPGLADGAAIPTNAGFVASPTVFIPKESVNTYEGGFKWQQSNGFINATAFYLDVSDFQNAAFVAGEIVVNSFDVEVMGLEIDTFHRLTDEFTITTGFGLLDGENKNTGGDITSAPSFTASATLAYETDTLVSGFNSRASLNGNYKSSHFLNDVNDAQNKVDGVFLLNANVGLTHEDSGVGISVFASNLTDELYQDFSFGAPFLGAEHMFGVARGRTVGVELEAKF